jgi:predicted transposase YbfD/YdcC
MVHSQRECTSGEHKGEASSEWRYYLSSRNDIGAAEFNQQIRQHWSIENGCHWVLDVNFRKDDCRIRTGHGAENFAILRRMTLNLINKNTTIKASKKSKRNLAAWSTTRLQELLRLQDLVAQEAAATAAA